MATISATLAAIAVQVSQPLPVATPTADDIIVVARRLKKVRWEFEARAGTLSRCKVARTSGSARVDALVCEASAQCAAEQPSLADIALVPCIRDRVTNLYAHR